MIIAKGAKVTISGVGSGVLSEDLTITLASSFKDLASDLKNEITQGIDIAGATVRSLTGGRLGFSSQFKQMTTQIWDKTDPAQLSLNVEFHRTFNDPDKPRNVSGANVMSVIKSFLQVPLPAEGLAGNLTPPGPSPIEGIGLDELVGMVTGGKVDAAINVQARGIVNVTVGNMTFRRMLMQKAEPTFNKYPDDSGYPISCRVAFNFISIWAATQQMISEW
jgi:hypothetical protein